MKQFKLKDSPIVYYTDRCGESADWVLFLHAGFVTHEMFNKQYEYFRGKYNILTLDIIGHGKSQDAKKGDNIYKMSSWIKEIMEEEGVSSLHIVGICLGSFLAQDFANKYPETVKSLSCFAGVDINNFDMKIQMKNNSGHGLMILKALFSIRWFAESNKKISAYTKEAQDEFYRMNLEFPKKSFMYLAYNKMINAHKTGKRAYPLLVGCGEHDIPMEYEAVRAWKKTEPQCRVSVLKNAGHCVNMDAPDEFNELLEGFWEG